MILPKTGHFFFNFKNQLLHIFLLDGKNQDMPYDEPAEESQNTCFIFSFVCYMSVNMSVYEKYISFQNVILAAISP